ncbi:hypothetical protein VTJ04DRAFT_7982 [Mycothermus thermophilus]|uniref:uncharacterized protein n=1 Tax=Humicola insolens TaxID=85995 RepID=UPI00374463C6
MRSPALLSLVGGLATTALATSYDGPICDVWRSGVCTQPAPQEKRSLSLSSSSRRRAPVDDISPIPGSLFARHDPECTEQCTGGEWGNPALPPTTVGLTCGGKETEYTVTFRYAACPPSSGASGGCLIFDIDGTELSDPQLHLSVDAVPTLPEFGWSSYCSGTQCVLPQAVWAVPLGLTSRTVMCESQPLHGVLTGKVNGETCWAGTLPIASAPTKIKRSKCKPDEIVDQPKQFEIPFECPRSPLLCCCCPISPEPTTNCNDRVWAMVSGELSEMKNLGCTDKLGMYMFVPADRTGANIYLQSYKEYPEDPEFPYVLLGFSWLTISPPAPEAENTCVQLQFGVTALDYIVDIKRIRMNIACEDPSVSLGDRCTDETAFPIDSGCLSGGEGRLRQYVFRSCDVPVCSNGYYVQVYADVTESWLEGEEAPATCSAPVCAAE